MAKNTSILLGEYFEEFIADEISSGKYNSASEVIRNALRLLKAEEQKRKISIKLLFSVKKADSQKTSILVSISKICIRSLYEKSELFHK